MAIFKKTPNQRDSEAAAKGRTAADRRASSTENAISIIGPGMRIVGDLDTDGTVRVEGNIEGTIRAGKAVVIGRGGEVTGDIVTQDAVIGGRVNGTVTAESRLELQSTCVIDGEVHARAQHLKLDEGARFSGRIHMIDGTDAPLRALPAETRDADRAS
jgi:cytoskeletal protein CcmA (bactofilin family)